MKYITVESVLDYIDEIKSNSFSRRTKLIWLNEIEYRIQIEIMLIAAENIRSVPDDDEYELIVPAPWHEIYYDYLLMKMSEHLEESAEQNNRAATFDKAFTKFMRWWADNYTPGNGKAEFKGYYVHGKDGTTPVRGVDYWNAEDMRFIEGFMIKIAPFFSGEYSAEKEYFCNNIVEYEHRLYWHIGEDPTTGIGPSNTEVWECILYSTQGPNIDNTLTQSGLAADAKAVGDRFADVDDRLDDVLDEMKTDDTLSKLGKAADAKTVGDELNARTFRVNIAKFTEDGILDNSNFSEAFDRAIAKSKYIYIPAGDYDMDTIGKILVTSDIDILCSDDAVFSRTTGTDWLFDFRQCNVKWNGGTFKSGSEGSKTLLYNSAVNGFNGGAINIKQCKSAEIFNVKSPYNNLPAVIVSENSDNVNIHHCEFKKCVWSAIHFLRSGKNLCVADCLFDGMYIPTNIGDEGWYCYAVCTGLRRVKNKANPEDQGDMDGDNAWMPPEGLIYTRNIVKNSEDSGLDTHGAKNVEISNNIITNCNTCITAYDDIERVERPADWKMSNVRIVNNICISSFVNSFNEGDKKHPYIMVSCYNPNVRSCENWLIENNIFETPNGKNESKSILDIQRLENVTIRNNRFKATSSEINHGITVTKSSNVGISNNTFEDITNDSAISVGQGSNVIAGNNVFKNCESTISQANSTYSYIESDDSAENIHKLLKGGVPYLDVSNGGIEVKVSKTYGITLDPQYERWDGASKGATYNASDETLEFGTDAYFVVGQRITIDDGVKHLAYVSKILSDTKIAVTFTKSTTIIGGPVAVAPEFAKLMTLEGTIWAPGGAS